MNCEYSLHIYFLYFGSLLKVSRKISNIDILNLTAKSVTLLWRYSWVDETQSDMIASELCSFINEIFLVNENNRAVVSLLHNDSALPGRKR